MVSISSSKQIRGRDTEWKPLPQSRFLTFHFKFMKKRRFSACPMQRKAFIKLLLIMKLVILFLIIGSLELHATGYGQVRLNLNIEHVEIKKALLDHPAKITLPVHV